jgi:hypothetical protein
LVWSESGLWSAVELTSEVYVALESLDPFDEVFRVKARDDLLLVMTCFVLDKPGGFATSSPPFGRALNPKCRARSHA